MDQNSNAMDRLRADLIRRARAERHGDLEEGAPTSGSESQPNMQERPLRQASRSLTGRPLFPRLFQRGQAPASSAAAGRNEVESPKSPDFNPVTTSGRSQTELPNIARRLTDETAWPRAGADTRQTNRESPEPSTPSPPRNEGNSLPQPPPPASTIEHPIRPPPEARTTWFHSPDPAEVQLAHLAEDGRRRREGNHHQQPRANRSPPKRFLYCFPWIKSRRIRNQILQCFVSGICLAALLSVYLALSVTRNINTSEMTIMLILVILFATVFFCYGLIRLCMLVVRGERHEARRARMPQMFGPGGYAVPSRPIPVVLARDEEAAGIDNPASKAMPPAYGIWRESVRVDPDRLFWQRNEAAASEPLPNNTEGGSAPRPPSYASDDGVSYIVEAVPRSTVPTADVPLPQHSLDGSRRPFGEQAASGQGAS